MNLNPFPITPELTAVAIAYRNTSLIADSVLPRVPVATKQFKYLTYPKGSFMTVPNTRVGRKGRPNEVELEGVETTATCEDEGLDDVVPNEDVLAAQNQPNLPDPIMKGTEFVTDLTQLAREKRTADLVFDDTQYAAANKVTLAGNDQWNVDHADSDPIVDITTGLDACIMRPNIMIIGQAAWTKLSMHKKIVKATYGDNTDAGIARRQAVAELFELGEILVGQGWVNTAKKGQAPVMARVWGKHCVLAHRNPNADTQRGVTYGMTAEWGGRIAGVINEPKTGLRGSQRIRVGETVKELLTANDLAYMIKNCVA